jgi:hypothetical protein
MTAVARLLVKEQPLLIGDLLLSNRPTPGREIQLPIVNVTYREAVGDKGPSGLCQKIAILTDSIAVGWSGNRQAAQGVLADLKLRCEFDSLNLEEVKDYLRRQHRSVWQDVSLAGFIFDADASYVCSFGIGCKTIESPLFGEIDLLGTGDGAFENYLQHFTEIPVFQQDPDNQVLQAAACGLTLAGNFFTMEQHESENLSMKFGGGYEIATLSRGKFVKLGDILYVFWSATVNQLDKSIKLREFPYCAFRYEYYDDLLVIRGIGIHEVEGTVYNETVFPVPPAYRFLNPYEITNCRKPLLNAKWVCNYVQIQLEPQLQMDITTLAQHGGNAPIQFDEHDGLVREVKVVADFRDRLISSIADRYGFT